MSRLADIDELFPPLPKTEAIPIGRLDPYTIERNYRELNQRIDNAHRAAGARRHAANARAVAQAFTEYANAFRKVARTKGADTDHAVAVDLAEYCERQAANYETYRARCIQLAERAEP